MQYSERKFKITRWKEVGSTALLPELEIEPNWEDFCDAFAQHSVSVKGKVDAFSPFRLLDDSAKEVELDSKGRVLRKEKNLKLFSMAVLCFADCDAAAVHKSFHGFSHLLFSTWEHLPEHPYFTLVLPFSEDISVEKFRELLEVLKDECAVEGFDVPADLAGAFARPAYAKKNKDTIFVFRGEGPFYNPMAHLRGEVADQPVLGDDQGQQSSLEQRGMLESLRTFDRRTKKRFDLSIDESLDYDIAPELTPVLIQDVLRQGQLMSLTGSARMGKSLALAALGVAVANGIGWLGFETKQSEVLHINLDEDKPLFVNRIFNIAERLGVTPRSSFLSFLHLRGMQMNLEEFSEEIISLLEQVREEQGRRYKLVIVDPVYRIMGAGGQDENSAAETERLIAGFESIATRTGAAIVLAAYSPSELEEQGGGERVSGRQVFARDPDAVLRFRELVEENTYRMEGKLREFPGFQPKNYRFDYPVFHEDPALSDVALLSGNADFEEDEDILDSGRKILAPADIWEVWKKVAPAEGKLPLEKFARFLGLTLVEVRQKILHLGPNPIDPEEVLRMTVSGEVLLQKKPSPAAKKTPE